MLGAVKWAGGAVPFEAPDCPASVEVRPWRHAGDKRCELLVVNLTTNALTRGQGGAGVIRYVTPHKGIRLRLAMEGKVRSAASLLGTEVSFRQQGGVVEIELAVLHLYDKITLACT